MGTHAGRLEFTQLPDDDDKPMGVAVGVRGCSCFFLVSASDQAAATRTQTIPSTCSK